MHTMRDSEHIEQFDLLHTYSKNIFFRAIVSFRAYFSRDHLFSSSFVNNLGNISELGMRSSGQPLGDRGNLVHSFLQAA